MIAVELYRPDELSLYSTGEGLISLSSNEGANKELEDDGSSSDELKEEEVLINPKKKSAIIP